MKESTKTISFIVVACVMLGWAITSNILNQPTLSSVHESIGEPFYPDFTATDQARSLVVTAIDEETVSQQKFEIKQVDGLWQIPSHEGYPAEAAERLAETAASLVGLTRDSLVGTRQSDHEKFGVLDPRDEEVVDIAAAGQSISLSDINGDALVDLIIGNQVVDEPEPSINPLAPPPETFYYVRRADESNVYKIPLNIELSTKFSDWIEPDLLQLEQRDLVSIKVNNYRIEEQTSGLFGQVKELLKIPGDEISLSRESSTDDWVLANSDPTHEKLLTDKVTSIASLLDNLEIVDVAKKPTLDGRMLLDADLNYNLTEEQTELTQIRTQAELDALSLDQKLQFEALQRGIQELQGDLESKGFSFGPSSDGKGFSLLSAAGELVVGTSGGLQYTLHVGKSGGETNSEIKVSGTKSSEGDESEGDGQDASGDANKDDGPSPQPAEPTPSGEDAKNRYMLIRVSFNEELLPSLPETPVEPKPPVKPEGYTPEEKDGDPTEGDSTEGDNKTTEASGDDDEDAAPKPDSVSDQRNPEFVKYDEALAKYETDKVDYEVAVEDYQSAKKKREEEIELGVKKAKILNSRFEQWYYVVSSESLQSLQVKRNELVEKIEKQPAKEVPQPPVKPPVTIKNDTIDSQPAADPKPEKTGAKTSESDSSSADSGSADSGSTDSETTEQSDDSSQDQPPKTESATESEKEKTPEKDPKDPQPGGDESDQQKEDKA